MKLLVLAIILIKTYQSDDFACTASEQKILNFNQEYLKNDQQDKINVPDDFMWGIGAAADQIEGNLYRDSYWLNSLESDEPVQQATNNQVLEQHKADIDRVKALGLNIYRMSISMSIIDVFGEYDMNYIDKQTQLLKQIKSVGLKVQLTITHANQTQFYQPNICYQIANIFDEQIQMQAITNEANRFSFNGTTESKNFDTINSKLNDQQKCATAIKEINPNAQLGFGLSRQKIIPSKIEFYDQFCQFNQLKEGIYLDVLTYGFQRIGEYHFKAPDNFNQLNDFISQNYYKTPIINVAYGKQPKYANISGYNEKSNQFHFFMQRYQNGLIQDDNKPIQSEGLYMLLKQKTQYKKDIWIAENGSADNQDNKREIQIKAHMFAIQKQFKELNGDVSTNQFKGQIQWTLVDNWEWRAHGFNLKFGLYSINLNTFKRTMKQSAMLFIQAIYNSRNIRPKYICQFNSEMKHKTIDQTKQLCDQPVQENFLEKLIHQLFIIAKIFIVLSIIQSMYLFINQFYYDQQHNIIEYQSDTKLMKYVSILSSIPLAIQYYSINKLQSTQNNMEQIQLIQSLSFLLFGIYFAIKNQKKQKKYYRNQSSLLKYFNIVQLLQSLFHTYILEIKLQIIQSRITKFVDIPFIQILSIVIIILVNVVLQRIFLDKKLYLISILFLIMIILNWHNEYALSIINESNNLFTMRLKILISILTSITFVFYYYFLYILANIDTEFLILTIGLNGTLSYSIFQFSGQNFVIYHYNEIFQLIILIICQIIQFQAIIYCFKRLKIEQFLLYQYLFVVQQRLVTIEYIQESFSELFSLCIILSIIYQVFNNSTNLEFQDKTQHQKLKKQLSDIDPKDININ